MLRRIISSVLAVSLVSPLTLAQSAASNAAPSNAQQPVASAPPSAPKAAMQGFGLEDGTPVKLRSARTISSADAHTGDTLDFEVLEDVLAGGALVVPKGGIAWGTVTEAERRGPRRRHDRSDGGDKHRVLSRCPAVSLYARQGHHDSKRNRNHRLY